MSLGTHQTWLEGFGPNRRGHLVTFEFLYDLDHPARRYRRLVPHGTIEPVDQVTNDDSVEPLGTVATTGPPSGYWPTGEPDRVEPVT